MPLVLNQLGSVFNIYALGPGGAELSVAIPVVTTLTFVFTAITSWAIGETNPQSASESSPDAPLLLAAYGRG